MIRAFLSLALVLTLVACGRSPMPQEEVAAQVAAIPAGTVLPPDFGDRRPVAWPAGQSPSTHAVHGIDVSVWQGEIDWGTARAYGVSFAYLKATEGGDRVDAAFARNWRGAKAAGVPRGAYHFFYHCRAAAEQARWFLRHVPKDASALPPVLDMEWTPTSPTCPDKRPAADVRRDAREFVRIVGSATGRRPVLYTTVDFYEENQLWKVKGVDFWLRSTARHPSDAYPGQHWLIWQYSATGRVPGIEGDVDLNAFQGGRGAFLAWAGS